MGIRQKLLQDKCSAYLNGMMRVNHAGEYGALRIYEGQLKVLSGTRYENEIRHMYDQEKRHLAYFEHEITKREIRPSMLMQFWHFGGKALGFITAKISEDAAMMCTAAVEEVIDDHYAEQVKFLDQYDLEQDLKSKICEFRAEELEHRDIGLSKTSNPNSCKMKTLKNVIKFGCKTAIKIAKRV